VTGSGEHDDRRTLAITVSGEDRPGLTSALFAGLGAGGAPAATSVEILDVEQVLVRGQLTLGVLVAVDGDEDAVARGVRAAAERLGLRCHVADGRGDQPHRHGSRMHVTLLGRPLRPAAVAAVTARLAERGANIDRIRRMSADPVTSLELDVSGVPDLRDLRRDLTATAAGTGVDVAVSPAGLARHGRRLVVMDVDSTLVQDEVIELLAAHAGRGAEVAAVTARAMRGELDFAESLHARVATLAGLPETVLDEVRARVRLTPGADTVARTLRRLGFTLALVSGGFHEIVDPLAESLGIRRVRANRLEILDGRLTGRVLGEVVDRAAKARALRELAAAEDLPLDRTVAIGDGANDLDMLAAAGLGIAFNAKPVVREQADAAVTVPYLDTVLFLLGFTRDEIDEADATGGVGDGTAAVVTRAATPAPA
jgi:phosphoserine phosphatase